MDFSATFRKKNAETRIESTINVLWHLATTTSTKSLVTLYFSTFINVVIISQHLYIFSTTKK